MAPIKCFGCNGYINKKSTSKAANNEIYRQFLLNIRAHRDVDWVEPGENSRICIQCYAKFRREGNVIGEPNIQQDPIQIENENDDEVAVVNDERNGDNIRNVPVKLPTMQAICCVCGTNIRQRISRGAVLKLWIQNRIFCNLENRSCPEHFENGYFSEEAVALMRLRAAPTQFTRGDNECLINLLTDRVIALEEKCTMFDFDNENMDDDDCKCLTGLSKAQFDTVVGNCNNLTIRKKLSKKNCVAIFLMKLRIDPTQKVLSMMFGMKPRQQYLISKIFHDVLNSLTAHFVPLHLGYQHITRQEYAANHSTTTSNRLCHVNPNSLVALVDATYLYHEKPRDHLSQRMTYSLPKRSNLVKFSVVTAPDGYIIDVTGPHASDARNNDSSIFNAMAVNEDGFFTLFQEGDNIVYDRGYRDSMQFCQNMGLNVFIPHFLPNGQRQLTTQQANESRLVTMLRWVIEAVFGRLQNKFRFLRNVVPNSYGCETFGHIFKVTCALSNAFFMPINESGPEDDTFCDRVLERLVLPNHLLDRIRDERLIQGRIDWPLVDGFIDLQDFPILSEDEIQDLTLGTYQIQLSYSYTSSHINNGNYLVRLHRQPNAESNIHLIRASIPSRFQAANERKCFIEYNSQLIGINAITGWACLCKSGARVLGMCGHVCSVIWFLSYGRHQPQIRYPSTDMANNLNDVAVARPV